MTEERAIATIEQHAMTPAQYDDHLAAAALKARSLAGIVEEQKLYTVMNGKKHLHIEAWITLAQGYGYSADIEWSRPVEGGGWEARSVVRNAVGVEVGHAEAEAGTKGDANWVSKPSFQQRSMAQTRAISKALAAALRWVVVLAGYSPTPAEEMVSERQAQERTLECPLHPGAMHTKKTSNDGKKSWWSHKQGDGWCNATDVVVQEAAAARKGSESTADDHATGAESTGEAETAQNRVIDASEEALDDFLAADAGAEAAQGLLEA